MSPWNQHETSCQSHFDETTKLGNVYMAREDFNNKITNNIPCIQLGQHVRLALWN